MMLITDSGERISQRDALLYATYQVDVWGTAEFREDLKVANGSIEHIGHNIACAFEAISTVPAAPVSVLILSRLRLVLEG